MITTTYKTHYSICPQHCYHLWFHTSHYNFQHRLRTPENSSYRVKTIKIINRTTTCSKTRTALNSKCHSNEATKMCTKSLVRTYSLVHYLCIIYILYLFLRFLLCWQNLYLMTAEEHHTNIQLSNFLYSWVIMHLTSILTSIITNSYHYHGLFVLNFYVNTVHSTITFVISCSLRTHTTSNVRP